MPLALIIEGYRVLMGGLLVLALASLPVSLWLAWRRQVAEPLLAVALVAAAAVASRAFLMGWLDAAAMPGINSLYMWPAQPPLAVFAFVTPFAAWRLWRAPPRRRSSSPA
ncbi:hypothetical protein [Neoroseomonas soli]|uniref:Uncharacterized protein n=1 Tax=Neoroseomonas soli TaxID=1081025 RepID=A0A9X9X4W1_9PROT|nr:hypothetical protein [Neoroseomonas soli]MBR0674440.1 hypothetical protein [Neoroseomonas soli]